MPLSWVQGGGLVLAGEISWNAIRKFTKALGETSYRAKRKFLGNQ